MRKFVAAVAGMLALTLLLHLARYSTGSSDEGPGGPRIVSLAPHLTGLVFALGFGERLVGVTTYCDYPPDQVSRIDRIGDFLNPNIEKIVSLKPDRILAERWTSSRSVPRLQRLGLSVDEFPTPQSLDEIYGLVRQVGSVLDADREAEALINDMVRRVAVIDRKAKKFPSPPSLYLEIDLPTWTVGRASFTNEAIRRCGARNIFEDLPTPAPQVSEESIIERNPDIIVSFASSAQEIAQRPGWGRISAVRNNRIIDDFSQALLSRGNQRIVDGMELLQNRLLRELGLED